MYGTPPLPHTHTHYKCGEWERSFLVYLSLILFQRFIMFSAFILQKKKNLYNYIFTSRNWGGNQLILTGEGGGGLANLVGTDYLFSAWAWPENLFKKRGKGGGSECWLKRETRQVYPCDYSFLQTTSMCMQSVCKCRLLKFEIKNKCLLDFHSIINMFTNAYKYIVW